MTSGEEWPTCGSDLVSRAFELKARGTIPLPQRGPAQSAAEPRFDLLATIELARAGHNGLRCSYVAQRMALLGVPWRPLATSATLR